MDFNFVDFNNYKSDAFKKVFTEYYAFEGITLKPDTAVFDEITNSANNGETKTFALIQNENIVAFIMFQILKLKTENKFFKHKVLHIEELYVIEEKRNQKIATALINKAEQFAKTQNVGLVLLTARPQVFEFYEKLGYRKNNAYECGNKLQCFTKELLL